jgi:hypothetical protein
MLALFYFSDLKNEDWEMEIDFSALIEPVAMRLFGDKLNKRQTKLGIDLRFGTNGSLSINPKTGQWYDHENNIGGGVLDLIVRELGGDHATGMKWLRDHGMIPRTNGANGCRASVAREIVVAEFPYHDEAGNVEFAAERIEFWNADGTSGLKDGKPKKTFRQKRPDPDRPGRWIYNVEGVRVIPYRLPEVIEAVANNHPVLIVEGEAKADLLWSWNVAATCNAGGACKWRAEHSAFLRGADVVIIPDADDAGTTHLEKVGAALHGIAKRVRVLMLPGLSPKGDIVDWAKNGTREQLDALIDHAPDWVPPEKGKAAKAEDELLDALSKMPKGVEFGRQRKRLAKQLGVSSSDINAEIETRRTENEAKALLHGHWHVEPWPEPVDGDSLIRDIINKVRKHVVMPHDHALAIALWAMLAWVHDEVATHSPILDITSAEPESGKSTTLGVVSFLLPRCVSSVEISEAALYRAIELWQPSFAIDEFDSVLADKDKVGLRSVINSGHTRGQTVLRCVGDDNTPQQFKTFAPKAIGMIGRKLPPATLSRCIIVELHRRMKGEQVEKFKHIDDAELADLRSRLRRWSTDNVEALCAASVSMPETFDNRRADNWHLQFAIADLAGAGWGEQARACAVKIEADSDTSTIGVRLLADIRRIFDEDGCDCMLSAVLVEKLKADPEQPWAEWNRGSGLTQNSLAVLLGGGGGRGRGRRGGFGIHPGTVHPSDGRHGRGYKRSQFEDAWARYCPKHPSSSSEGE